MLEGIKIVEYATYMAAPGAASILCDWGAEVIKIEPPGGDPIRKFFKSIGKEIEENPVFDFDNRGKKSIILDTTTDDGQTILKDLVKTADVFLTNVRPGGLSRSGLDYESLSGINPKLVYCSITGYGLAGPDADRPGFDAASFWARAGVAMLTVPKGQEPFLLRTAFGDHTTSMAAAAGICAALLEAERTGKGRLVEASLLRSALYALGSDLAIQLFFGRIGSTKARSESTQPLTNFFKTRDEKWFCIVSRQGNVDWPRLCRAVGLAESVEDERFSTARARGANTAVLIDLLDSAIAKFTQAEIAARLDAESIVWAPAQTLAEVVKDPQVHAAGGIVQIPKRNGEGTYPSPASPIRFADADDGPKGPSPSPGEHTTEILKSLGKSESAIKALKDEAIVHQS